MSTRIPAYRERPAFNAAPQPNIVAIRAWQFAGNHAMDEAAFKVIDSFVRDDGIPVEVRAEALWIMGREGMGLTPEENCEHMDAAEYVKAYIGGPEADDGTTGMPISV